MIRTITIMITMMMIMIITTIIPYHFIKNLSLLAEYRHSLIGEGKIKSTTIKSNIYGENPLVLETVGEPTNSIHI